MNNLRNSSLILLILTSLPVALITGGCDPTSPNLKTQIALTATQVRLEAVWGPSETQTAAAEELDFLATETADAMQTEAAKSSNTQTPAATVLLAPTATASLPTAPAATRTPAPEPTRIPTPELITSTFRVGEVAKVEPFSVSVTEARYEAPNPKGAYFITLVLENRGSTALAYSVQNFSITNTLGIGRLQVLPKLQGSTWSDDFLPNSSVPPNEKSTLKLLAEHSGQEKDFVLVVSFGRFTARILLGH